MVFPVDEKDAHIAVEDDDDVEVVTIASGQMFIGSGSLVHAGMGDIEYFEEGQRPDVISSRIHLKFVPGTSQDDNDQTEEQTYFVSDQHYPRYMFEGTLHYEYQEPLGL